VTTYVGAAGFGGGFDWLMSVTNAGGGGGSRFLCHMVLRCGRVHGAMIGRAQELKAPPRMQETSCRTVGRIEVES